MTTHLEMCRTCGLDFGPLVMGKCFSVNEGKTIRNHRRPDSDELMERLKASKAHWAIEFIDEVYCVVLIGPRASGDKQTGTYPDPRMALLEAVMMIEQGKRWRDGWVKI